MISVVVDLTHIGEVFNILQFTCPHNLATKFWRKKVAKVHFGKRAKEGGGGGRRKRKCKDFEQRRTFG